MKKCPVCGSSKYTESSEGASCKKCGYTNKKDSKPMKIEFD